MCRLGRTKHSDRILMILDGLGMRDLCIFTGIHSHRIGCGIGRARVILEGCERIGFRLLGEAQIGESDVLGRFRGGGRRSSGLAGDERGGDGGLGRGDDGGMRIACCDG
ncbi:hypothetical protein BLJAPNOD_06403 [Ensifer sp. M14]|nr:hypothetical protein BLJAPNOD_06403 [Ensifer sp. M14]